MKLQIVLPTLALLAVYSSHAFAFEQQQGAPTATPAQTEARSPVGAPKGEFASPSQTESNSGGTQISIPGLGNLGVLPKMDFGLELLYGAEPERIVEEPRDQEANSDELRIRGTIKHQF